MVDAPATGPGRSSSGSSSRSSSSGPRASSASARRRARRWRRRRRPRRAPVAHWRRLRIALARPIPAIASDHARGPLSRLRRQPADGHPDHPQLPGLRRHRRLHHHLRDHGRRPERRRRLRGPPRPRLRRVLRHRGVHGGWLASGHFQQVTFHFGAVGITQDLRDPHLDLARADLRGHRHGRRRHPHRLCRRCGCAATIWRSSRSASARSSRSSSATPTRRRLQPHQRDVRHQPD